MKTTKITLKSKRGNEKEHAHIDVYYNEQFIGYITSPKVNTVDGLWHFSSKSKNFANISDVTKKALLDRFNY